MYDPDSVDGTGARWIQLDTMTEVERQKHADKDCLQLQTEIAKKQIDHTVAYQARVRARMSACSCSLSSTPLAFVTECRCPWTPWSPPSVKATPTAPDEEPAA